MTLAAGARFGSYEIAEKIGEGGMGEVYRASDPALGRDVAIKVLPDLFATDPERLARFEREARTLASLNHPNIATIYGFHDAAGVRGLVMELVEGPTLADRVAQGSVPLDEALPVARQIAEALEAAHEQGIVHRDLKPANVKVRPDGVVKVLDFGLAKALEATPSGRADATLSPTIASPATQAGMILGTAAYMAPEQARGRAADRRSDIWAFGCVLFEMITGRRTFGSTSDRRVTRAQSGHADDVADTLAAVLRAEPDWSGLPDGTPASIRRLLVRCLQKDARRRLPHIGAARLEIEDAIADPGLAHVQNADAPPAPSRTHLGWFAAVGAAGVAALLAIPAVTHWRESSATIPPEMRIEITTPPTPDLSFAISLDGHHLAFVAADNDQPRLWVRSLGETVARPLPGTEDARLPFWSADGRSIGFFSGGTLKRIDVAGGSARPLAEAAPALGGAWNTDGTIVFAGTASGPLLRVPATGGEVRPVTTLQEGVENGHAYPSFLPDQRRFVFYGRGSQSGLYLGSLDSTESRRLGNADGGAVFAPPDWLLFVRDGALVAQRVDTAAGQLTGNPVTIAGSVSDIGPLAGTPVSASHNGVIAYRGDAPVQRQLAWFDRSGKHLGYATTSPGDFVNPALAPDGRIAVQRMSENNVDIWILDGLRMRRLTTDAAQDRFPIWSADGAHVLFASNREGRQAIFEQPSDGSGAARRLLDLVEAVVPSDVSRDGRFLLFLTIGDNTREDIGAVTLDGTRKPFSWVNGAFSEMWAQFSPDGSWGAYQSNESGRLEVYVRRFPGPGGQWPVSTTGGIHARWAPNGRELFYIAPDGYLMAVPVRLEGTRPEIGAPVPLFKPSSVGGGSQVLGLGHQYDVAPDGRFLINVTAAESVTPPITLLLNWNPARTP
jgi:eukaryotic-like serine/threonine-protein kinase